MSFLEEKKIKEKISKKRIKILDKSASAYIKELVLLDLEKQLLV